jgi:hypothetical protein
MTYLGRDDHMQDEDYCRQKEAEYAAKARATNNRAKKCSYEAAAREYSYRLILIGSKKTTLQ